MPSITTLVPVTAGGVVLRSFVAADIPALVRAFADEETARWNPGPDGDDAGAAAAEWLARRNDWREGNHASWAVATSGGELVGSVSVHKVDHEQGDAEVGYWVGPWARGQGWGTLALRAASRFAFTELNLHRLYLYHAVENVSSCRLAVSAGYAIEGTLREAYRYGDGIRHDEHLHARLASDADPGDAAV